jgi:multicomponent Na+:H+ antiporter subunit D
MIAPTPVSALLHAVAVVKAGVFGVVRIVGFVFGPELLGDMGAAGVLAGLALTTILLASLAAAAQDNLKRLLAFSTISQLSYVVLGVALGTQTGFAGGVIHIASHALLKITLFFCAGAIYVTAHVERVSDMAGLGRRMPWTMGAFAAAAFMLAGMPPGAGFVSKWRLIEGAVQGGAWVAVLVLLAGVVLNVAYFTPVIVRAFAGPAAPGTAEAPASLLVPLLLTAAGGLLLGLVPDGVLPVLPLALEIARSVSGR